MAGWLKRGATSETKVDTDRKVRDTMIDTNHTLPTKHVPYAGKVEAV